MHATRMAMPDAASLTLPDAALLVLDADGSIRESSEQSLRLLGLPAGEAGCALLALCPERQPDGSPSAEAWRVREAAARAGLPQSFGWQFRRRDGATVDVLVELARQGEHTAVRLRDLTSLRSAERALRDSQSKLQQIVDHTSAAVFAKGLDGRYLFVNREFARLAGRPAPSIAGCRDEDLFPSDVARAFRVHDARVLKARQAQDVEERLVIGGREHTYLAHKFPLLAADGQPYAVCGIATDITARKRTEEALRAAALAVSSAEGEDVFHELVRFLATILQADVAFVSEFSDASLTTLRMLSAVLDGRFLRPFEYPLSGSPCAKVVGRDFRFVAEGVRREFPPGTIFEAKGMDSYAALPLVDSAGRPLGIIAVMNRTPMTDAGLTEAMLKIFAARAAAEIERRRAVEALAESESSYRAIFEASADAIFVHEWDTGRILDVSRAAEDLYGWTVEELKRLSVEDISAADEGFTQQRALEHLARARNGESVRAEWRIRHRSGRKAWHEVRIKAATIAGKKRLLAYARDISAAKAAEEALRASEEQYRAIFDASADALVLWNSGLQRVDVNPAFERIFGFTRDEMIGGGDFRDVPDDEAERRRSLVRRSLAGEPCHLEFDALRKNGERFRAEVRTIPIRHRGEPHVLAVVRDITERTKAEAAVRASEEQYRAIFSASLDGMLLWDEDHRVVDVNDAFLAMHGYRRDELVGQVEPLFMPASLRGQCDALLRQVLDGAPCRLEARGLRKDGTEFDVEIRGQAMRYQGRPHALIMLRDVTAARQAEQRLRASEKRYRLLFEMESDAILVTDAVTLDLLDANRAAAELWGYDRDELLRMKATDLSAETEATRVALQGESGTVAVPMRWHRKKDGRLFPVEITLNRFELDGRRIVLSAIRDVTDRRQREEALARSEGRLRATIEAAFDCVVGMDAGGNVVEFNPAAERTFGYRREQALGRSLADLIIPPAHRAAHQAGLTRFHATRTGPYIGQRVETVAMRASGEEFPVELAISVAHSGEQDLFIGYLRDVSERKAAEARRSELEAQLRQAQKMEALGHLTGGIAHDFNNLLTSIMGYVALAGERDVAATDERLGRYLEQARVSCVRARDLIQQMLTFSRGRRGAPRALALAPLVGESVKLLRASFPASIALDTSLDDDAPAVMLDPVQLEQVLMNLAINARDAMDGAGRIEVSVRSVRGDALQCASCRAGFAGTFVELAVADDGPGIAPAVGERMFEPFFSTKAVGRGTGMGLATVHGIVHELGGHIVVRTGPGQGSRFAVLLPALDVAPQPVASAPAADRVPLERLAGRVLVVEDEQGVAAFMRDLLESWSVDVTVLTDPVAALERFRADPGAFDLVITDQTMPGMTGLALARELAALRPGLPILLYTGYGEGITAPMLAGAGVAQLLPKPLEPSAAYRVLAGLLPGAAG